MHLWNIPTHRHQEVEWANFNTLQYHNLKPVLPQSWYLMNNISWTRKFAYQSYLCEKYKSPVFCIIHAPGKETKEKNKNKKWIKSPISDSKSQHIPNFYVMVYLQTLTSFWPPYHASSFFYKVISLKYGVWHKWKQFSIVPVTIFKQQSETGLSKPFSHFDMEITIWNIFLYVLAN